MKQLFPSTPDFIKQKIQQYIIKQLRPYQKSFLVDKARFRIVNKSRQIGFSYLIALEMIIGSLLTNKNQLIISASQENAFIVLDHVREHLKNMKIDALNDKAQEIEMQNGKIIKALATNWKTARGFAGDVFFDEFAFMIHDSEIWRALVPAITAAKGKITVISTPKSRIDKFWDIWENNNIFSKHQFTIYDAVKQGLNINIDELKGLFPPEEFAMTYECLPLDTTDSYISYNLIEPCIDSKISNKQTNIYAADIGRVADETAIIGGYINNDNILAVNYIHTMKKTRFYVQKLKISDLIKANNPIAFAIDKGGIGYNLWEDLTYIFPSIIKGYAFAPAVKERMAKNIKRAFEEKKIRIPNDPSLINHILSIKRSPNRTNIFSYNADSKQHHGDKFWALAMLYDIINNKKTIQNVQIF
ncbi:MAG: terminase family protein [Candidatus Cloacimonetes bacterium]|nr:terminase family protein [Candidatus Cloacimonadota bacterium]